MEHLFRLLFVSGSVAKDSKTATDRAGECLPLTHKHTDLHGYTCGH